MIGLPDKDMCTGCTACVNVCPKHCLEMRTDKNGFPFPEIVVKTNCIACGACEKVCPILLTRDYKEVKTTAYAALTINEVHRMDSSSGGIFTELADNVLKEGGIVFGASYDANGTVKHIGIDEKCDLSKLRGAKYSQSVLGECFHSVKYHLNLGKKVLFSGTPCQVAGLKAFLQKDYVNLICIDCVCHGVPSPMVWEKYVQYRAQLDAKNELPVHINLRNKESGWNHFSYSVEFNYLDGKRYICKNSEDLFMRLFVGDYISRESCANCHFKGYDRVSDITLGDFWGIWDIYPEMDDNKGTSLVLTHTNKGEELLQAIADIIKIQEVSLEQASQMNPSLLKSSQHKLNREFVLNSIAENGFQEVQILTLFNSCPKRSIIGKAKRCMQKIFGINNKLDSEEKL